MKKILFLFLFFTFSNAHALNEFPLVGTSGDSIRATNPTNPPSNMIKVNKTLNVIEGIDANHKELHNQFFNNNKGGVSPQVPTSVQMQKRAEENKNSPRPGMYPNAYGPYYRPRIYSYGHSRPNTINNYNIHNNQITVNNTSLDTEKANDKERVQLRKKYNSILSNKNTSDYYKCKRISSYYKKVSKEELRRILNDILLLDCSVDDISH